MFIRQVNSAINTTIWKGQNLNLADIVGGGNGLGTGKINMGIDHQGQTVMLNRPTTIEENAAFTTVTSNRFVDSVFIPNGQTQIDSAGTIFYDFETTNGAYSMGVLNGAWHQSLSNPIIPRHQLRLEGVEYGTREHPAIYMHANQGVTFDLEAIRQSTRLKTARFQALCGISETAANFLETNSEASYRENRVATFKVLIDGRERFVRTDITHKDSPEKIDIELRPQDRYLTLVTTQGSIGSHVSDWTLFAEPTLALEP